MNKNYLKTVAAQSKKSTRYLVSELLHVGQYSINIGHHIFSIHQNRSISSVAQRSVQYRSTFCEVYFLSREHGIPSLLYFTVSCLRTQESLNNL